MLAQPQGQGPGKLKRRLGLQGRRVLAYLLALSTGFAVGAMALAYALAGEIYDYQDTADGVRLPPVDVIVCLAGGRGRIAAAGDIWFRYWEMAQRPVPGAPVHPEPVQAPVLYFSGLGPSSNWNILGKSLRRGVHSVIQPENVVLETKSDSTEANAEWVAGYARERGWKRILLITSRYHMKRSRLIFEQVFARGRTPLELGTFSVYQEPFEPGEWRSSFHGVRVTLWEYLKWIYYKRLWKA
jgi:uncharacterized SAM-binding protein YcdF (DUF218 family)